VRARLLTDELHSGITSFECGDEPYARAMSEWIRGNGCLESTKRGTEVWLFFDDSEIPVLIGFGSLGPSRSRHPTHASGYEQLQIIPALAVSSDFQGRKEPGHAETYAHRIFDFLIQKAFLKAIAGGPAILVLYVDPDNRKAIRLYERLHFELLDELWKGNAKMALDLSTLVDGSRLPDEST